MPRKFREGRAAAEDFDKLPQRCKEIFFAYLAGFYPLRNFTTRADYLDFIGFSYEECKSPIEIIFNFAYDLMRFDGEDKYPCVELERQYEIEANGNRYIADFAISKDNSYYQEYDVENPLYLIIECDGHEFHEKTKEQVEYRNRRDLDLQMAGYDVLHYSGSQIYNEAINVAKRTILYMHNKMGKRTYKNGRA